MEASSCAIDPPPVKAERGCRIMVVDDDRTTREFLRLGLGKAGYEVISVEGVVAAKECFEKNGFDYFDCVVTDYQLIDGNGIDVLTWVKGGAPWLATVVITAESERSLIKDSLRSGAFDFLDKPVQIKRLSEVVSRAGGVSRQQKHSLDVETAVRDLGRAQESLLQAQTTGEQFSVDICFHPKLEAGGDFFTRFEPSPGQLFCLLTDVSGHDLQAAYISAYFQGMVRGMLKQGAGLDAIFSSFNQVLAANWDQSKAWTTRTSLAASALMFDFNSKTALVLTCGVPTPLFADFAGKLSVLGDNDGSPLGWFEEIKARSCIKKFDAGSVFYLWTDGLEELAVNLGVSPVCLGIYLQTARKSGNRPKELLDAKDDILFATVTLGDNGYSSPEFQPVVFETHHGAESDAIDEMQNIWRKSLRLAMPEINGALEHDIILASREIVLNAMNHGCQRDAGKQMSFQIVYFKTQRIFKILCEDPGEGHGFDIAAHEEKILANLAGEHLGLILARHLSSRITFERKGATVMMEFVVRKYEDEQGDIIGTGKTGFQKN